MKIIKIIGGVALALLLLSACNKEEGFGGNSKIYGKAYEVRVDRHWNPVDTFPIADQDIYIRFGESNSYDERVITAGDGYYEFNYLRPGDYSMFTFSDCPLCSGGDEEVELSISLAKNEEKEMPNLYLQNKVDYDDGDCAISGKLMQQRYNGSFPIGDPEASQENEVYIVYGDDAVYFDRMDTGSDGGYEFIDLIPGTYIIYAYSECLTCTSTDIIVSDTVVVTTDDLYVTIPNLLIEKR